MLFRDYKEAYVKFCEQEILREIDLIKRRYLRTEKRCKDECILNEKVGNSGTEKIDLIIGEEDIPLEALLPLNETIENGNIAKNMKRLSDVEQKVVSLRLEEGMNVKEINIVLGTNRPSTSSDIFRRAIKKIKKDLDSRKGE